MKQEEKIKDLEERIAIMEATDSALCADLAHWKKVAAGLKGKVKQLTRQVEHYKALDKEGDEINESHIAIIEEKELVIMGLQEQVNKLANKNEKLVKEADAMKQELDYFYNKKPWYKRIF